MISFYRYGIQGSERLEHAEASLPSALVTTPPSVPGELLVPGSSVRGMTDRTADLQGLITNNTRREGGRGE